MKTILILAFLLVLLLPIGAFASKPGITNDPVKKTIIVVDSVGELAFRVGYDKGCVVEQMQVMGKDVVGSSRGAFSAIRKGTITRTSRDAGSDPVVELTNTRATISGIGLSKDDPNITEKWTFEPLTSGIRWRIERTTNSAQVVEETFAPDFHFGSINDWTGALLGNGGVAWFSLFDSANATYGVHTGSVLLWTNGGHRALSIRASTTGGRNICVRFTRMPDKELSIGFTVSEKELIPRYDQGLHRRRYLPSRTDVWAPHQLERGTSSIQFEIRAVDYIQDFDPGIMPPFDAREIQLIANTIARIGVIDSRLHGGNSWRTPYGPICLHEQYIAQLGLIMQDTEYVADYQKTLDYYRDHAISPDGRVKSRWAYTCEDAMPGTCDSLGFYEAQWGYLLDSNPDFVTNVAELFDLNGDVLWLRMQQSACERALDYIISRDSDGNGLVEMITDSHKAARGSDWIDVIWASYENAFVNAKLYYALSLWSELEELLGNPARADMYRTRAALLKATFNRPTNQGGFWSSDHNWYIHWRDKDGTLHGDNLVTFVNFMAIAYGLCDDRDRATAVLRAIERQMEQEHLFFWPICMFSYAPDEGIGFQFPFPAYENGDIFLSLGEVGVRAYGMFTPEIPLKYLQNLIARYRRDGLAFQRYLRTTQAGSGDDILAGNALPIVGLYRDLYGIQPKYNRLYLEPHMTKELEGASINYRLRGKIFRVTPSLSTSSVSEGGLTVAAGQPFGFWCGTDALHFFSGRATSPSLTVVATHGAAITINIDKWDANGKDLRAWRERCYRTTAPVKHEIFDLAPQTEYAIVTDGMQISQVRTDSSGRLSFPLPTGSEREKTIEIRRIPSGR